MLNQLFTYIQPGTTLFSKILKHIAGVFTCGFWIPRRVTRIGFVATKADRVHQDDRSNLLLLLKDLTQGPIGLHQAIRNLHPQYFVCSAVDSTQSINGARTLDFAHGQPPENSKETVSQIPTEWPDTWEQGRYIFVDPLPACFHGRVDAAPKHIDLNLVAEFILSS